MSQLVTLFGGSGFVGRYVVRRLLEDGFQVRVAVRNPEKAELDGKVEAVKCNILDDQSIGTAIKGSYAVVNCVGILDEAGASTFAAIQATAPGRIAQQAADHGVLRMIHISSIGASLTSPSEYSQTKAKGENAVLAAMPDAVILRPSIIFGAEDQFFNRFATMARFGPTVPVVGADTRFQPVYVDDVAEAVVKAIQGQVDAGIYELGGPDVETFRALMNRMLNVIERKRLVLSIPTPLAKLMALGFSVGNAVTFGLLPKAITADQIKNLAVDNIVAPDAIGFAELGIVPKSMDAILPSYLSR